MHAVDRSSRAILRSHDLDTDVHTLEVSPNGTHLYLVHDTEGGGLTLTVLQASDFSVTSSDAVPDGAIPIATAVSRASDGRFLVLVGPASAIRCTSPTSRPRPRPRRRRSRFRPDRSLLAIAPDGATAFVAGTTAPASGDPAPIESVDLAAATFDPRSARSCPACSRPRSRPSPSRARVARRRGCERRGVGGRSRRRRRVRTGCARRRGHRPRGRSVGVRAPVDRRREPVAGRRDPAASSPTCRIRSGPRWVSRVMHTTSRSRPDAVYVAYTLTAAEPGGVAVFEVEQHDCRELLWKSLDGCDDCDEANCVVLATITGYRPGFVMLDCRRRRRPRRPTSRRASLVSTTASAAACSRARRCSPRSSTASSIAAPAVARELRARKDRKARKDCQVSRANKASQACRASKGCRACKGCKASRAFKARPAHPVKDSNPISCASPR